MHSPPSWLQCELKPRPCPAHVQFFKAVFDFTKVDLLECIKAGTGGSLVSCKWRCQPEPPDCSLPRLSSWEQVLDGKSWIQWNLSRCKLMFELH